MSDAEFDAVQAVHLKSSFACSKAVWPIFRKQQFGRIVNTASAAGLYGQFTKKPSVVYRPTEATIQATLGKRIIVRPRWVWLRSLRPSPLRE
jgi:NAD(P)-dependent dehydrogenase (short-subunit alcohol dehydrogenase family)